MPVVADERIMADIAAALATRTGRAMYVYEVPASITPVVPYGLVFPVGGQWDRAQLQREHLAGWYAVQVTSVGKGIDAGGLADFVWLAGKVRAAFDAGPIAGTGWQSADAESEGPPLNVEHAGTLLAVAETFRVYVQAV